MSPHRFSSQAALEPDGHLYLIHADAEPGAIERILALFTKRSVVPRELHVRQDGHVLRLLVAVAALEPQLAATIEAQLGQIFAVRSATLFPKERRASEAQAA